MTNNIYDTANQLERDLRSLDAFKSLAAAMTAIKADSATNELFTQFQQLSQGFQMKQMMGEQPSEDEMKEYQAVSEKVMTNETIKQLMDSERLLSQVMEDINRIITKPLQEIYAQPAQEA